MQKRRERLSGLLQTHAHCSLPLLPASSLCCHTLPLLSMQGDWAYNFEDVDGNNGPSSVGNGFMELVQGYASLVPVQPAAGNHER